MRLDKLRYILFVMTALLLSVGVAFAYSPKASRIQTNTANFDSNLSVTDNTVQKALDTLDDMAGGAGVSDGDKGDITISSSGTVYSVDSGAVAFGELASIPSGLSDGDDYEADTDTQLSDEDVQDKAGAMFTGNTETRCTVTYQDDDGTIDVVVDDLDTDTQLSEEQVEDFAGSMLGGTETRIAVTYDDSGNAINFVVDDMNDDTPDSDGEVPDAITVTPINATTESAIESVVDHDELQGFVANEHIDWTGSSAGTIHATNYVDNYEADTDTNLTDEQVEDYIGAMLTGNTETNITVTYQDEDGTIDFVATSGGSGSFDGLTLSADSGADQEISNSDTIEIAGGDHISTVASATDTVTINLDSDVCLDSEITPTGAVSNGSTSLPTADHVYDYIVAQSFITDGNTNWNNSYNLMDWDTDTAAVSNGDTTHVSTADAIYDFCETTQNYLKTSENSDSDDDVSAADLGNASANIASDGTIEWEDATDLDASGDVIDDSHNHIYSNIDAFTEAQLYTILSDVTQFYESGDKVGDADTLDTHDTAYFAVALGADDNYVTDAEKVVIGNTSGTNTGDDATDYISETELSDLAELDTQIGITGTASSSTYWRGDNSWATPSGGGGDTSGWLTTSAVLYVDDYTKDVAIGGNAPGADVFYFDESAGDLQVPSQISHAGDSNTVVYLLTDQILFEAGGRTMFVARENGNDGGSYFAFNPDNTDTDFYYDSDTTEKLFHIDADTDLITMANDLSIGNCLTVTGINDGDTNVYLNTDDMQVDGDLTVGSTDPTGTDLRIGIDLTTNGTDLFFKGTKLN